MIEMVTGGPGAGKTTFAVATRIAGEVGRKVSLDDETCIKLGYDLGTVIERRIVCAGVRGLKLEHERVPHILTRDAPSDKEILQWNAMQPDKDKEPVHQRLPGEPPREDVPCLVENWWLWCKPGDFIVIDEAQYLMPRGSMGRIPPYWLWVMSTHRHYGVDFLIITQAPEMIETHVKKLVTLHRHVRPVLGSPLCMVYVWDHASNTERFNLASKTRFLRRAKHYALFHSSVAHVKPQTQSRAVLVAAPLLLLAVGLGFAKFRTKFDQPVTPVVAKVSADVAGVKLANLEGSPKRPRGYVDVPELAGCFTVGDDCRCMSRASRWVRVDVAMCRHTAASYEGLIPWEPRPVLEPSSRYGAAASGGPARAASSPLAGLGL